MHPEYTSQSLSMHSPIGEGYIGWVLLTSLPLPTEHPLSGVSSSNRFSFHKYPINLKYWKSTGTSRQVFLIDTILQQNYTSVWINTKLTPRSKQGVSWSVVFQVPKLLYGLIPPALSLHKASMNLESLYARGFKNVVTWLLEAHRKRYTEYRSFIQILSSSDIIFLIHWNGCPYSCPNGKEQAQLTWEKSTCFWESEDNHLSLQHLSAEMI